ncbi:MULTISPECIES: hypothetical protein [unclassified Paenibacillus]|uniref:hypothetical protein n=1 Tax=unclassified Paenibacillus TaxID=185978 RepID=UPI001C106054|nr:MULTISPECIES: hypothetical protein [unclassified Paenibacillus]MBU5441476.1 hypothetical protein [Paenibacillus sp. MSJ-34]CAH0118346.1 hypothetical protein PAE9249_00833 [Paenibacillus sp. CECT 9249]
MFHLCPLCNGLTSLEVACPVCTHQTIDYGKLDDFAGPYSPYEPLHQAAAMSQILLAETDREHYCVHVLYCANCNRDYRCKIQEWGSIVT